MRHNVSVSDVAILPDSCVHHMFDGSGGVVFDLKDPTDNHYVPIWAPTVKVAKATFTDIFGHDCIAIVKDYNP